MKHSRILSRLTISLLSGVVCLSTGCLDSLWAADTNNSKSDSLTEDDQLSGFVSDNQSRKDFRKWDEYVGELCSALNAKDMAKAKVLAQQLMTEAQQDKSHPALAAAYASRGWIQTYDREYTQAVDSFNASIAEFKKYGSKTTDYRYALTRRWLVSCFFSMNKYAEALPLLDELIKDEREGKASESRLGINLSLRAECRFRLANYSAAETDAKEAARLLLFAAPPDEKTTIRLLRALEIAGRSQVMLWKFDDAENTCKITIALEKQYHPDKNSSEPKIMIDMARAQIGSGKFDEAGQTLKSLIASVRSSGGAIYVTALQELAKLKAEQGLFEESVATYDQVDDAMSKEKNKANIQPHFYYCDYAHSLDHIGRLAEAEKYYNEAAKAVAPLTGAYATENTRALYQLSSLYRQRGQNSQADHVAERFVALRDSILKQQLGGSLSEIQLDEKNSASSSKSWVVCSDKHAGDLNKNVLAKLTTGLNAVPQSVRKRLRDSGVMIALIPRMSDLPVEEGARPPGYHSGATLANEQAHTSNSLATVFMAESYKQYSNECWVETEDAADAVRHEIGHVLDTYLMGFSDRSEFIQAYAIDSKAITPKMKRSLAYMLQPGSRGRRETFADLAAIEWGSSHRDQEMKEAFPRCLEVVRKCLSDLDKATEIYHVLDPSISKTSNNMLPLALLRADAISN